MTMEKLMLTLQQILSSQSTLLEGKSIKLVRHKDVKMDYRRDVLKDRAAALEYQREQADHIFEGCDFIISFFGLERRRAIMFGVFKVNGHEIKNGKYYYDLEQVTVFDDLADRLIIGWGGNARAWHQWYHRQQKEVLEIRPRGSIGSFPGLLSFALEFHALKTLTSHPEANTDWQHRLSSNGIYMILDDKTGAQYIGSAYGNNGIWQRWCNYAVTGHGGNKELIALMNTDPEYTRHFRFSVLQALPGNITPDEIIEIEQLYKKKLGTRVHGLNAN